MKHDNLQILKTNKDVIDFLKTQPSDAEFLVDTFPINRGSFENLKIAYSGDEKCTTFILTKHGE